MTGNPFTLLDRLRSTTEGHKVAFHDLLGVGWVEPKRERLREVVGGQFIVYGTGHVGGWW